LQVKIEVPEETLMEQLKAKTCKEASFHNVGICRKGVGGLL